MKYTHRKHHKAKNLTIKIDDEGNIIVTTPRWISERRVEKFLDEKRDWIEQSISKIQRKKPLLDTKNEVMLFGKKYPKRIIADANTALGITLKNGELLINQLHLNETKQTALKIQRFLRSTAEKYLLPRTHQIGKHMKIEFGKITLREQKTRWGSCSNHGNLNFNWRLVHHPTPVIDYVIVHELAHRVHLNHSTNFWKLVEKFQPEYRIHEGWLKRKGKVW